MIAATHIPGSLDETLVIAGAGQAAAELAIVSRQHGYNGRIVVIGDEPCLPYQRPPLSKDFLAGKVSTETLHLRPAAVYEKARVELLLDTRVTGIDRSSKTLALGNGATQPYGKLVLATGGRARRLSAAGADTAERLPNFHYLRSIRDVEKIRPQLRPGLRMTIIGGGYIGLEVAAVVVKLGVNVTVLEAASRVLERVTAPVLSAFYEKKHRDNGVVIRTGIAVNGFSFNEKKDAVSAVLHGDGCSETCDLVIAGVGLTPNTELAGDAGLQVDNGIVVDAQCRTSDPDIFAIGDCASFPNPFAGRRLRLESVPNAIELARIAAAAICHKPAPAVTVPWFWSNQYDLRLQMAGLSHGYDQDVLRGNQDSQSFAVFYFKKERLIAVDVVNRPQEFMLAKRFLGEDISVSPDQAADESIPLKSLLPVSV